MIQCEKMYLQIYALIEESVQLVHSHIRYSLGSLWIAEEPIFLRVEYSCQIAGMHRLIFSVRLASMFKSI